jgi:putative membrane protein
LRRAVEIRQHNSSLAAGLVWSLRAPQGLDAWLALFFVSCVLVAGLFGITVSSKIVKVQAIPAACALVALLIHWPPK